MDDGRARLLEVALDAFGDGKFAAMTVNDLRSAVGVSNGSFFHHFPTKDHLVAELLLDSLTVYHQALEAALESGPPAATGVGALVAAHLRWVSSSVGRARVLFVHPEPAVAATANGRRQDENQRFGASLTRWRDPLVAVGDLVDVPLSMFVAQVIGPAQVVCRGWLSGRTTTDPVDSIPQLVALAQRALVTKEVP